MSKGEKALEESLKRATRGVPVVDHAGEGAIIAKIAERWYGDEVPQVLQEALLKLRAKP